ncbi:ATP-dependent DNA ligase [Paenibacillaceae bacterium]|nr:ATP-dependent DNA ligase [Paenibacillaceae bacterium]
MEGMTMFFAPMPLEQADAPFDNDDFLFEPKIDGQRLELAFIQGRTHLFTRHGNDVTRQYPELHFVPVADGHDVVLDGEVAYVNPENGLIQFEPLMQRVRMKKKSQINDAKSRIPVRYFVFDILYYNGEDLRDQPLSARKELLANVMTGNQYFKLMTAQHRRGTALFQAAKQLQLDGIVGKRKSSPYIELPSDNWQTINIYHPAEVSFVGYRKHRFGWLFRNASGTINGVIEHPVSHASQETFLELTKPYISGEDRNHVYLEAAIKGRIRFRSGTRNGMVRLPELIEIGSSNPNRSISMH